MLRITEATMVELVDRLSSRRTQCQLCYSPAAGTPRGTGRNLESPRPTENGLL